MFTVGRGWKGWFVERVSDAGVVSPGSPGGSRHFLRSCWIFLTTVVTLSCVASVCFTYFVKWANTTATNFLVALIYILTNALCLWSIGCNRLSPSHWLCYCGGGQPQRWIWNDMKNECRFRKGRDVGFKSDTFKRRICEVSMGGHQCAVLLLLYTLLNVTTFWFLVLERQTHARHGARSIIEFFLLTLWFHTIRHLACPRSLLLQTFTIVYHIFHIVYVPGSLNASTFAMVWIRHNQKDFELGKSHPDHWFPVHPRALGRGHLSCPHKAWFVACHPCRSKTFETAAASAMKGNCGMFDHFLDGQVWQVTEMIRNPQNMMMPQMIPNSSFGFVWKIGCRQNPVVSCLTFPHEQIAL